MRGAGSIAIANTRRTNNFALDHTPRQGPPPGLLASEATAAEPRNRWRLPPSTNSDWAGNQTGNIYMRPEPEQPAAQLFYQARAKLKRSNPCTAREL